MNKEFQRLRHTMSETSSEEKTWKMFKFHYAGPRVCCNARCEWFNRLTYIDGDTPGMLRDITDQTIKCKEMASTSMYAVIFVLANLRKHRTTLYISGA